MTVDTCVADIACPLSHPRLVAIPAFSDNYIWALTSADGRRCLVVDPGDAAAVSRWLAEHQCVLTAILITHHHVDHVGGLAALRSEGVTVYGPRHEAIAGVDVLLGDGDTAVFANLDMTFTVMDVPGHTSGHIAYHGLLADPATPVLFCGDTLFSAGCGRLFEGSPAEMQSSLARLAALDTATLVCCAHEYTLGNLRFAAAVEPDNADVAAINAWAHARRDAGEATVPSSIARELRINPFLRTQHDAVIAAALQHGAASSAAVEVFAVLRRWKDGFR